MFNDEVEKFLNSKSIKTIVLAGVEVKKKTKQNKTKLLNLFKLIYKLFLFFLICTNRPMCASYKQRLTY
jgi:hypothetical protein